ncbi:MAG TPA: peptide-binding protein, partial [Arcobacter sp.]|nr:peptide-binding protein [Arcobacter sp.]
MLGLMLLAYLFSFAVRLIWVYQFQDNPNFIWNGELMINTNDGYFFAAGAQQELFGLHESNPRVFGLFDYGVIFFTTLLVNITPFSLETVILYMPSVISSLVVIPIILIARLYNQTLWGFFAALLGSITWSYYNRTMVGYYDTDMFSAMAPMFILFFLIKSTLDFNLRSALYAAVAIAIYPFLYDAGLSIVYAMGIMYALYMLFYHNDEKVAYLSLILVFIALLPFPFISPFEYLVKILVLVILYVVLYVVFKRISIKRELLILITALFFLAFLFFGNVFGLIIGKVSTYLATGTVDTGLRFYSVAQTVREAGSIPFETFANRTSGSVIGVLIALVGYAILVIRHRAFILALPLIGIGIFALWGGLRFTVYAVPVAAMSAIYLFFIVAERFKEKKWKYPFIIVATALM